MFASGHAGATGSSLLFFSFMILEIVLGLAVFSYTAHSFLTIVVDTAAGTDHVLWPAEPYTDWLWKPWYLAWLVAIWLTPLALILGLFKFTTSQIALIGLILFWLIFPVGLLSSLSATTRWAVFRPVLVWYMLRHFPSTAIFYAATEIILAAWALVMYFTFWFHQLMPTSKQMPAWFRRLVLEVRTHDWILVIPFAALTTAAVLFLYARLVGRLAWVINQRRLGPHEVEELAAEAEVEDPWRGSSRPSTDQNADEPPPATPKKRKRSAAADPWAASPEDADPDYWKRGLPKDVQEAGRYEIQTGELPAAPPAEKRKSEERPRAVYAAESVAPEKPDTSWLADEVRPKEREPVRRDPESPSPEWPMPLFNGVYSFLGYRTTLGPLLTVALGFFLMGLVWRQLSSYLP